jgi:hypothetical protein
VSLFIRYHVMQMENSMHLCWLPWPTNFMLRFLRYFQCFAYKMNPQLNLTRPQSAAEGIEHRFLAPLQVIFAPFSSLSSCNAADLVSAMQGRVRAAVEHLKQVSCSVSHIYPDDAAAEHFPRFWL